jgi:hypothetical protein
MEGQFHIEDVDFPMQANERTLAVLRRHPWFLWPRTLLFGAIAIVPVALMYWLLFSISDDAATWFTIVAALWILFWGIRMFLNWYQYQHDLWVVTSQRLIDSRKPHPFNHTLATADLVNLQDITVDRKGIMANVLGFGNVRCETASERGAFTLSGISRPVDVQLLIDKERDRERMRRE